MAKLKEYYSSAANYFHNIERSLSTKFLDVVEAGRDVWAAMVHDGAMNSKQRHLDEFKLAAGVVIAGAGTVEVNPLMASGGVIPAAEALHEMQSAGHKWRKKHGELALNAA